MHGRTILLLAVLGAPLLTPAQPALAAGPVCQTDAPVVGDVDGDGISDLLVGRPHADRGAGVVDLRLSAAPTRVLTETGAGITEPEVVDAFGSAVALADLDGDGCDDMIVGAPGTLDGAGRVYVVSGSPAGFDGKFRFTLDGGSSPADRFGSAIAVAENPNLPGFDLWVGSPDDSPGAVARAGSVTHFTVRAPAGQVQITEVETISQATAGVPGSAEVDDHFGAVLSATGGGVLVGVPNEDIGRAADAGAVVFIRNPDTDPGFDDAVSITQDTAGVAGTPEAGDRFGAAVAAGFDHALVGVPGEDLGRVRDAGAVQTFRQPFPASVPVPVASVTQDSRGIPGAAEAGDQLGAAVLLGRNVGCVEGVTQAVAGAPGEDIRVSGTNRVDAGTVLVLPLTAAEACPVRYDDQSTVLSGTPETGDRLGRTLGLGRIRDDHDDETGDRAFIGVPNEDRGTVSNAGIVQSTASGTGADANDVPVAGQPRPSVGSSDGAMAGEQYGLIIASPAG